MYENFPATVEGFVCCEIINARYIMISSQNAKHYLTHTLASFKYINEVAIIWFLNKQTRARMFAFH